MHPPYMVIHLILPRKRPTTTTHTTLTAGDSAPERLAHHMRPVVMSSKFVPTSECSAIATRSTALEHDHVEIGSAVDCPDSDGACLRRCFNEAANEW
jgi:hypothetical protein